MGEYIKDLFLKNSKQADKPIIPFITVFYTISSGKHVTRINLSAESVYPFFFFFGGKSGFMFSSDKHKTNTSQKENV